MASVVIYTRQFCGYCSAAKKLLETKGVDYSRSMMPPMRPRCAQKMIERSNGGTTFPQIFINNTHIGGCDDLHALDRAGKLDEMLAA